MSYHNNKNTNKTVGIFYIPMTRMSVLCFSFVKYYLSFDFPYFLSVSEFFVQPLRRQKSMHWGELLPEDSEVSLFLTSFKFLAVLNSFSGHRTLVPVTSLIHNGLRNCSCATSAFQMASTWSGRFLFCSAFSWFQPDNDLCF